jgi:hypothetical protein
MTSPAEVEMVRGVDTSRIESLSWNRERRRPFGAEGCVSAIARGARWARPIFALASRRRSVGKLSRSAGRYLVFTSTAGKRSFAG